MSTSGLDGELELGMHDCPVLFGLADDRRTTGDLARAVSRLVHAEDATSGRRLRRRLHATVVLTDADVGGFDARDVEAAVRAVHREASLRGSLVGVVPVDAETAGPGTEAEASVGCGGIDHAADRLQRSVLGSVLRVTHALASATVESDERPPAKVCEAVEQLDGVAVELLGLIEELRVLGGR